MIALDRRDRRAEEGVQHPRDRRRLVVLGERREAHQVGEEDGHRLRAAVDVEAAEALLRPFLVRHHGDHGEREQHQQMPFPPRRLPVAAERHRDHRLGEQHEGDGEAEHEPRVPLPVEVEVADDRVGVAGDADDREHDQLGGQPRRHDRVVDLGEEREADDRPESEQDEQCPLEVLGLNGLAVDRRQHRECAGQHEPDRRRDHEAEVRLVEQDAGRRECVQREEAGGREERERDEVDAPVASPPGRDAGRIRQHGVQGGGDEDEPEVGRVVLPVHVRLGRREQDREPHEGQREQSDEGQRGAGHRAAGSRAR